MRSDPGRLRVVDGAPAELAARVPPGPEGLRHEGRAADGLRDVDDEYPSPGRFVREQRLRRGWSLEQLAAATKVPRSSLGALEDDRYEELPGPVFVKGFFKCCARALGLDGGVVLDLLYERERAMARDARRKPPGAGGSRAPSHSLPVGSSSARAPRSEGPPAAGTGARELSLGGPAAAAARAPSPVRTSGGAAAPDGLRPASSSGRDPDGAASAADVASVELYEPEGDPADDPSASASDRRRRRSGESRRARKAKARAAALSAASGTQRLEPGATPPDGRDSAAIAAAPTPAPADARALGLRVDDPGADELEPQTADVSRPSDGSRPGGAIPTATAEPVAHGAAARTVAPASWIATVWTAFAARRGRPRATPAPPRPTSRQPPASRSAATAASSARGLREPDWRRASTSIPIAQGAFGRAREAERRFEGGLWHSLRAGAALPSLLLWLAVALFVGVVAFAAFSFGTFEGRVPTRAAPSAS